MKRYYRGQTEPFAALISIFAMAIGISLYVVTSTDIVTELGAKSTSEQATLEAIWQTLNRDGIVRIDNHSIESAVQKPLPAELVCVSLSVADSEGKQRVIDSVVMDGEGTTQPTDLNEECSHTTSNRPDETANGEQQTVMRTVPVKKAPGEIRPGQITVTVYE